MLDGVQYALSNVAPAKMLHEDDRRLPEDAALEYLRTWRDRGFGARLCDSRGGDCADAPEAPLADVAAASLSAGSVDVLFQRLAAAAA